MGDTFVLVYPLPTRGCATPCPRQDGVTSPPPILDSMEYPTTFSVTDYAMGGNPLAVSCWRTVLLKFPTKLKIFTLRIIWGRVPTLYLTNLLIKTLAVGKNLGFPLDLRVIEKSFIEDASSAYPWIRHRKFVTFTPLTLAPKDQLTGSQINIVVVRRICYNRKEFMFFQELPFLLSSIL